MRGFPCGMLRMEREKDMMIPWTKLVGVGLIAYAFHLIHWGSFCRLATYFFRGFLMPMYPK